MPGTIPLLPAPLLTKNNTTTAAPGVALATGEMWRDPTVAVGWEPCCLLVSPTQALKVANCAAAIGSVGPGIWYASMCMQPPMLLLSCNQC